MVLASDTQLRRAVCIVAALNFAYFGLELAMALRIGSVSLLADSVDFFEDAAVNFLVFAALGWSPAKRAGVGMLLSAVLLVPAVAFVWTLLRKLGHPTTPDAFSLTMTGLGALAVNLFCALVLGRYRDHGGSLSKAAFLSARNDVIANVAIIAAGAATAATLSPWPDIIVGFGVAAINVDAAREVWRAARVERQGAMRA